MAVKEKIRIRVRGYDHQLVDAAAEKIVETAKRNGAQVSGPIPLPTDREIVTILRAVHKYKDSREQFEMRTHKRLIDILRPSNKAGKRFNGLVAGTENVDESLVGSALELLTAILVLVDSAKDSHDFLLGGQRDGAGNLSAVALCGLHDLSRAGVDQLMIISLQPDADHFLVCHG